MGFSRNPETEVKDQEDEKEQKSDLPVSIDWKIAGKVSPVMNQAECAGDYAIAAAGLIESTYMIDAGISLPEQVKVSAQQLIDCSSPYGNKGCEGGNVDNSFTYANIFAIAREEDYPYTDTLNSCASKLDPPGGLQVRSVFRPQ